MPVTTKAGRSKRLHATIERTQLAADSALERIYQDLLSLGSLNPEADLAAIATGPGHNLASLESYRTLMEPVFRYQVGKGLPVTVFRPIRTMEACEIHNWLIQFKCYDPRFEDVAYVLDPTKRDHWRIFDSGLRFKRLYFPVVLDNENMVEGKPCQFEYVTIPANLDATIERTGYTSQQIQSGELLITHGFPEDPRREFYRRA
jgi:hypothetical protein